MSSRVLSMVLGLCLVVAWGMYSTVRNRVPPAAPPGAASPVAVPASTIGGTTTPVTDAEANEFADKFVEAINAGDSTRLNAVFDGNVLADRCLQGVNFPPRTAVQARTTMVTSIGNPNGLFMQIHRNQELGGSYKLVRIHDVAGEKRALFRMIIGKTGGVNYHDVLLRKDAAGPVRGYDVYIFLTGEMLSETMKRVFLPIAAQENRSFIDRLAGNEQLLVKHMDKIASMSQNTMNGKPQEALRIYAALPPELQKEKIVLLQRMRATQESGNDDEYDNTLADYRKNYPADACIEFLSIDYYLKRKEYDKTMAAIDSVDKSLGGDAYMKQMRSNVLYEMGRLDEAKKVCAEAIQEEPDMLDAHWTMVGITLKEIKPEETLKHLKTIEENFTMEWNDLSQDENYKSFTASPQYQEWLDFLKSRGKEAM